MNKIEKFLEKIPNWLRWIMALPVTVLISTAVQFIIIIGNKIFFISTSGLFSLFGIDPETLKEYFTLAVNSWLAPYLLVWIGAVIVPKRHLATAITLAIAFAFVNIILSPLVILTSIQRRSPLVDIIAIIIGLIATISACYEIHKRYSVKSKIASKEKCILCGSKIKRRQVDEGVFFDKTQHLEYNINIVIAECIYVEICNSRGYENYWHIDGDGFHLPSDYDNESFARKLNENIDKALME